MGSIGTFSAWGDSLTAGSSVTPYPSALATLRGVTVNNMGVGGETSTQIKARFIADTAKWGHYTLIWSGRNNSFAPTTVKADIAAMIAALPHTRYLVMSIQNGTAEPSGNAAYVTMMALNADLAALYPGHYLDVRSQLVAAYDPAVPQDVIDHGNDVPPSSLRLDAVHLNSAGYLVVARAVNSWLTEHP